MAERAGKVALVTGGRGIGFGISARFLATASFDEVVTRFGQLDPLARDPRGSNSARR